MNGWSERGEGVPCDQVQQVALVADVVVQRRCTDPEPTGQWAHSQPVDPDPDLADELQRGASDRLGRDAGGGVRCLIPSRTTPCQSAQQAQGLACIGHVNVKYRF